MMLEIIDSQGNVRAIKSVKRLKEQTKYGLQKSFYQIGKELVTEFNGQVLAKNKGGRIYVSKDRLGRRKRHQASDAGQTPANRTGNYRKSIGYNVNSSSQLVFGNSADYSGFLENGTSRMKPRPGLDNSIRAQERNILRTLTDGISEAL